MMEAAARPVLDGCEPDAVAVAFPGPIDPHGHLLAAPTVWGRMESSSFPLRERLFAIWPRAVVLALNDMTAAGYRYVTPEVRDFCLVTVSSGIGNKVFLGRRLVSAARTNCWNLEQDWDAMVRFGIDDDDAGLLGAGQYAATVMRGLSSPAQAHKRVVV